MDKQLIKAIEREIKAQDKLVKLVARIRSLSAAQKKKIETILGGPMEDEAIDVAIGEAASHRAMLKELKKLNLTKWLKEVSQLTGK